ncbi:MAG: helix-turn-helix transcriptional regulator [Firmicutes bacterium]|jgi:putative transcriptional regulator|nr:helix-turn-helix transcriptional regulator [Candidatus Fermentithermobacillaceae bacterium]
MPIIVRLDRVMVEQKVTLTDLAERVGITLANLSILKTGKARAVRFSTLEAICRELKCQPGDLLEYVPNPVGQAREVEQQKDIEQATDTEHSV